MACELGKQAPMGFGEGFGDAIRADWRRASWPRRATLAGVLAWLAYEWGPGNETVTPWLLVRVLGTTPDGASVGRTAAVGFAFTAAQQLASGLTALAGFSLFGHTAAAAADRLYGAGAPDPLHWRALRWPARAAMVFALGTTAVALVEVVAHGPGSPARHRAVVARAAGLAGVLVAAIGTIGGALFVVGQRNEALRPATSAVLRVMRNPLPWLALGVLTMTLELRRRRGAGRSAT